MKKALLAITALGCFALTASAQKPASIETVIKAEEDFNKLAARKGIKEAFLTVADPEGIVFKPEAIKITDFYGKIDKQPGSLTWQPKFARISSAGDLAFTSGPYVYTNGKSKSDDDKVYGHYVSIWRTDLSTNKFKLLMDLGIQHPESEKPEVSDIKDASALAKASLSKEAFGGKKIIIGTDREFNQSLKISSLAAYKEFFTTEGHFLFPGFQPMVGSDQILKFLDNQGVVITAETVDAGRASSNDLSYSYGKARIRKGNIVSNYNYVRIWELDAKHRWNILLEVFSAVENE